MLTTVLYSSAQHPPGSLKQENKEALKRLALPCLAREARGTTVCLRDIDMSYPIVDSCRGTEPTGSRVPAGHLTSPHLTSHLWVPGGAHPGASLRHQEASRRRRHSRSGWSGNRAVVGVVVRARVASLGNWQVLMPDATHSIPRVGWCSC